MNALHIFLFGKFCVQYLQQNLSQFDNNNVKLLLSFVLLGRDQSHSRDTLATLIWPEVTQSQSKAYLRKTLWQLRTAVSSLEPAVNNELLLVEPEWIQANPQANIVLDVDFLEEAFSLTQGIQGRNFDKTAVALVKKAISSYKGCLLDGWYHDWCLYERERLQQLYTIILDKYLEYCLYHQQYEEGIFYGLHLLAQDPARERTHRRLMSLYYLLGDRTESIRQYERCESLLQQGLGVAPSSRTTHLYKLVKSDQLRFSGIVSSATPSLSPTNLSLLEKVDQLQQLQKEMMTVQTQISKNIQSLQHLLRDGS
ncbi:MAG: hypothetical protein H6656_00670 [Ardenticatenaceae bacterium]|nr:hypothetical protein [Anaerolineales bacterium]MCB9005897.1 hypothetical protein [Ardenticatenaceae bacterium]